MAELRERYLANGPRPLTLAPGPGRRADELERLEEARRAAEIAREAAKVAATAKAEQERKAALATAESLKALKGRVDAELGAARGELRRAADHGDYESALAAASRVVALELVSAEVVQAGRRFGANHRSALWYGVSAGVV